MAKNLEQRYDLCLAKAVISGLQEAGVAVDRNYILQRRAEVIDEPRFATRQFDNNALFVTQVCAEYGLDIREEIFPDLKSVAEAVRNGEIVLARIFGQEGNRHVAHVKEITGNFLLNLTNVKVTTNEPGIAYRGIEFERMMNIRGKYGSNAFVLSKE